METAAEVQNFSLTMNRQFKASKKEVYLAWTDKQALTEWFAPTQEMTTVVHQLELHVGGKYRIEMIEPDGMTHKIHGEYLTLTPYDQIIFTWEWESDEHQVNSLVTIDLNTNKGSTEMTLTHEKLDSQEFVDMHSEGWTGCLGELDRYINQ